MSHDGTAPTAQEPVDRKALLLEQFSAEEAAPARVEAEPEVKTDDRPRDDKGKFAPREARAPAVEAAPVAEVAPVEAPLWERPPASWKKDKHELWQAMTPQQKEYAFAREQEMKAGVEPLLPKAQLADQITKVAEPYINTIRGMGMDLPTAVGGLMKVDHDLRTLPHDQKVQRLLGIAQHYGIDLSGAQPQPQAMADPQFYGLHNELLDMKGKLAQWEQEKQAAEERAVLSEIQSFSRGKEHFEIARPFMIEALHKAASEGVELSLDDAYESVTGPGGALHDLIAASKQVAAIPNQRAALDKAAKAARAAAVSVRSATPGSTGTTKAQDRRSMLREQIDGVSDRL